MEQKNKELEVQIFDGESKIIIKKTNNKNSYCKYINGSFVVTLGKFHNEQDAIKLVNKIKNKFTDDNSKKASLAINFDTNSFNLFGEIHYFEVIKEEKQLKILNKNKEEILKTKLRIFDEDYITKIIESKFINIAFFKEISILQAKWEEILGLKKHNISFVKKIGSWASNSLKTSTITYNFFLYNFSLEIIESVVIHELAHDIYQNHSKDFYNYVLKVCPNYKTLHLKNQKHIFK